MDPTDNPYEILGVSESATAREIRTAYRRLALEHHPDRNPNRDNNDSNHKLFAKINHAYEVLTNPDHHQSKTPSSASTNRHPDPHYYPTQQRFDPFAVFDSVFFQDDFFDRGFFRGGVGDFPPPFWQDQQDNHHRGRRENPPPMWFDDPFFKPRNSLFRGGNDFFGPFGRGMDDWFQSTLEDAKNNHRRHDMSSPSTKTSFYSSSTLSRRNSKGQWVTESTVNENGNVTTERITRDAKGNILQRETIEQGPSSTKKKHLPPPSQCDDTHDHGLGGDKKRLPAPADTTTTAGPKKFRLPWRRGDE